MRSLLEFLEIIKKEHKRSRNNFIPLAHKPYSSVLISTFSLQFSDFSFHILVHFKISKGHILIQCDSKKDVKKGSKKRKFTIRQQKKKGDEKKNLHDILNLHNEYSYMLCIAINIVAHKNQKSIFLLFMFLLIYSIHIAFVPFQTDVTFYFIGFDFVAS